MATKGKRGAPSKQLPPQPTPGQPPPGQQAPDQPNQPGSATTAPSANPTTSAGAATGQSPTSTIKKGIYLSALVYVEGNQAPADDFNSLSISLLKKNLNAFFSTPHDGLTMSLKSVDVQNDVEVDDGGGDSATGTAGKKKEDKFQF